MFKKAFLILALLISVVNLFFGQYKLEQGTKFTEVKTSLNSSRSISLLTSFSLKHDSLKNETTSPVKKKKSPALAFLYSLIVPGTGQLYTGRFDVGKYYMISEAALWLGFASFTIYGNWLLNDAHKYAQYHAGIDPNGKDDNFFVNISNYDNIYQYNDDQLRNGRYDLLYDPAKGYYFYWDDVANRKQYRTDQLAGDRVLTDRAFIAGAILLNHVISAISAIFLTNSYNDEIKGKSGGFVLNADVINHGPRVDGLQLKLTKWF